jgi:hypothetical protein
VPSTEPKSRAKFEAPSRKADPKKSYGPKSRAEPSKYLGLNPYYVQLLYRIDLSMFLPACLLLYVLLLTSTVRMF